jgi:hypothetical protein
MILGPRSSDYKQVYLLGYNALWSIENKRSFRRNMPPFSSEAKNKPSTRVSCCKHTKQSSASYLLFVNFLLGFFLDPEDGGEMFFRNVS